ncbi:MAG: hypothetical protein H7A01_09215 [Hahellaceae bacterium]|nr:hypothetical protein [Hahellaceae bacterium]MCP5211347.1 hypothetical protein [Hahellaceae bacterium]
MKWVVLAAVVAVIVLWLKKGRQKNAVIDPDVRALDQKRFYVTPGKKDDNPPDDHESTSL